MENENGSRRRRCDERRVFNKDKRGSSVDKGAEGEQASCPLITSLVAPNERRTEEGMRQSFLGKQSGRFVNQPRPFRLHDVGPLSASQLERR